MSRVFVRFPEAGMLEAVRPFLNRNGESKAPYYPRYADSARNLLVADLSEEERYNAEKMGARVYPDVQFYHFDNPIEFPPRSLRYWEGKPAVAPMLTGAPPWHYLSQTDVMRHINAPTAWKKSRGKNVTIGIVDTGVAAGMAEFPATKQSSLSRSYVYQSPWADPQGHGSMCASAAAATRSAGGRYEGVAPDADIMSLRTDFRATDLYRLYEHVLRAKKLGEFPGPVVLSNSFGNYVCQAPFSIDGDYPFLEIVRDVVAAGIPVIFAAGNNHAAGLCNLDPDACSPNTIWSANSLDDVLSVGTVNWDEKMNTGEHANSSRGPGQFAVNTSKPDCVAPTYGETVWGNGYQKMEWWGTSGACPQVAGLCALILAKDPTLTPHQVYDRVRSSCRTLPLAKTCAGAGIIDCAGAV